MKAFILGNRSGIFTSRGTVFCLCVAVGQRQRCLWLKADLFADQLLKILFDCTQLRFHVLKERLTSHLILVVRRYRSVFLFGSVCLMEGTPFVWKSAVV